MISKLKYVEPNNVNKNDGSRVDAWISVGEGMRTDFYQLGQVRMEAVE